MVKGSIELRRRAAGALLIACGSLLGAGCGDDDGGGPSGDGGQLDAAVDAASMDAAQNDAAQSDAAQSDAGQPPAADPVYVVVVRAFGDPIVQYAKISRTLDFSLDGQDLKGAREFSGRATFVTSGGFLYVGNMETQFFTKYRITEDLQWVEEGKLFVGDYDPDYMNLIAFGDEQAYSFYADGTSRIVLDLKNLALKGPFTDSELPVREGWMFRNTGQSNRGAITAFKNAAILSYEYAKEGETAITDLAVYDPTTHAEARVLATKCPQVEVASQDEEGNTYYSSVFYRGYRGLFTGAQPSCVIKIKPDGTLDQAWGDKPYTAFGSDHGEGFQYLGNGKAVATFTKASVINGLDPANPPTDAVLCQVGELYETCGVGGLPEYNGANIMYQGLIDLKTNTVTPITGWESDDGGNWYRIWNAIDGHFVIGIQRPVGLVWYELNPATATVTKIAEAKSGELEAEVALAARLR